MSAHREPNHNNKWDSHYLHHSSESPQACQLLQEFKHLLPAQGRALDLACGRGGNAILLASHGLESHAWDSSAQALQQLDSDAQEHQLTIHTQQRDVIASPPAPESFAVIVVSRFLHRPLCPSLIHALRPGGLLFYQTFTRKRPAGMRGPSNPDYLLAPGELAQLFAPLRLRLYREEGDCGDLQQGLRGQAWLIAQQPSDLDG